MNSLAAIDVEKCDGCGLCVDICPTALFTLQDRKATVTGASCLACGHCEAVCPNEAVAVAALNDTTDDYATLQVPQEWMPYGRFDTTALVSLMRSRRSCRQFLETSVDYALLQDLAHIGASAPSGTNCQAWTFTILPDRTAVLMLLTEVQGFFKRLNRIARMPLLRAFSRIGSGELDKYYRQHCDSVDNALSEWETSEKDRLFFGAPSVILVGSKPGGSTPVEDALLATQNILLAAHAMGLGSCLIGFAVAALKRSPAIRKRMGLPEQDMVHAVIALGYADRTFLRITRRKKPVIRVFDPPETTRL